MASPGYLLLHDALDDPLALARHRIGVVRENQADTTLMSLIGPDGTETTLRVHPVFACNDGEVLRHWALDGFGIVERSEWSVSDDLRSGCLVRVLPDWSLPDADIVAPLNPRAVRAARIDAFVDRLATEIRGWRPEIVRMDECTARLSAEIDFPARPLTTASTVMRTALPRFECMRGGRN